MVEQIFKRKSIRKYKDDKLPAEAAEALVSWRDWVQPLRDRLTIDNHIRRLDGNARLKGMFLIKAPAYIMYTSQEAPLARVNAGFILEQISLGLGLFGVGTCYLGDARAATEHMTSLRYDQLIMMAYGMPDEPLTRAPDGFRRKRVDQICPGIIPPDMARLIDAARVAPSSMNRQPWRFVISGNEIHCCVQRSGIGGLRQLCEIDLGIAMSHIYLTALDAGAEVSFSVSAGGRDMAPRGADYVMTICLN